MPILSPCERPMLCTFPLVGPKLLLEFWIAVLADDAVLDESKSRIIVSVAW